MLSVLLLAYGLCQIIMTLIAILNFYMYGTTAVEFFNTAVFWPFFLLKNLFYALLLAFKE